MAGRGNFEAALQSVQRFEAAEVEERQTADRKRERDADGGRSHKKHKHRRHERGGGDKGSRKRDKEGKERKEKHKRKEEKRKKVGVDGSDWGLAASWTRVLAQGEWHLPRSRLSRLSPPTRPHTSGAKLLLPALSNAIA